MYLLAYLNMYRTMIMNTITNREDRATITAIIGVSSKIKKRNILENTKSPIVTHPKGGKQCEDPGTQSYPTPSNMHNALFLS